MWIRRKLRFVNFIINEHDDNDDDNDDDDVLCLHVLYVVCGWCRRVSVRQRARCGVSISCRTERRRTTSNVLSLLPTQRSTCSRSEASCLAFHSHAH